MKSAVLPKVILLSMALGFGASAKAEIKKAHDTRWLCEAADFRECFGLERQICDELADNYMAFCAGQIDPNSEKVFKAKNKAEKDLEIQKSIQACTEESIAYVGWKRFRQTQECVDQINRRRISFMSLPIRWIPLGKTRWKPFNVNSSSTFVKEKFQNEDDNEWDAKGIATLAIGVFILGFASCYLLLNRKLKRAKTVSK